MKVICALLCLGVAHGHIFPRERYNDMERLIIQPLDYIDQYQQQDQNQLTQNQLRQNLQNKKNQRQYQEYEQKQRLDTNQQTQRDSQSNEYTQDNYNQQQRRLQQQYRQQKQQTQQNRHHGHSHSSDSTSNESNSQERNQQQQKYNQQQYKNQQQKYNQQHQKYNQQQQNNNQQQDKYSQQHQEYNQPQQNYNQDSNSQEQDKYNSQKESRNSQESSQQDQPQYNKQEQYSNSQEKQYRQPQKRHDQVSSQSDSTSQENNDYISPRYANVRARNVQPNNQDHVMNAVYADPITWKGVKMAVDPESTVTKKDIENIFSEAYKSIKQVSQEEKDIFHQAYEAAAHRNNEDSHLNATQLLQKYQYNSEKHTIKTDDGYLLTLFRIQPAESKTLAKPPVVFLMHGLLGSADDWLLMGPSKSLAYMLVDAGYEVWLGNARGSKYSRRHVSKNKAQSDFWQFSNDEIALHDLPTMIDYALKTSEQQKLYYVGHSQGTTVFFTLASSRPEYNDKIIMMYALSPMAYMSNVRSPMLRMIAPTSPFYERLHQQLGHGEFKPNRELVLTVGGSMLANEIGCRNVSSNMNFVMSGVNVDNMDVELIPVIMHHLPAGASTRQIKQYAQGVASHEFTKYNFGAEMNEKVYGNRLPPKNDIKKVKTPVALYHSEADWMAHPKDVQRLQNELPNVKESYKVPVERFSHMDFQFSKMAPEVVNQRLIDSIKKQQSQQDFV